MESERRERGNCAWMTAESVYAGVAGQCDLISFENMSINWCTLASDEVHTEYNFLQCHVGFAAPTSGISRLKILSIIAHLTIKLIYCVKK